MTYEDMARGIAPVAGISLQYDGAYVEAWMEGRELLRRHGARVTIFVTRYARLLDEQRVMLRELRDDGHDLEPHGVGHLRRPVKVEQDGLHVYLDDEVQPSIDVLRADGYEVVSFAYPFGDRTDEIDRAVARRVPLLRSLSLTRPLVTSPCPYCARPARIARISCRSAGRARRSGRSGVYILDLRGEAVKIRS